MLDVATGERRVLLTDEGPEFTPNGSQILYCSARSGAMRIWRMDADGSRQAPLTGDGFNDWFPHASPDG